MFLQHWLSPGDLISGGGEGFPETGLRGPRVGGSVSALVDIWG